MMRKWLVKPKIRDDHLKKFPDYNPVILQLLHNRGLQTLADIAAFLHPRYEDLGSPFLLSGMNQAVERVLRALNQRENITVYADYDADAVTACTVLFRALKALGGNVSTYIPDRFAEGYGVNAEAVREISSSGATLLVTVDCGIGAVAEVALARELGMDVVVTDHHEIMADLPKAFSVVNPKRNPELSNLQGLTGVGVAFKLVCGLLAAIFPQDYARSFGWVIPEKLKASGAGFKPAKNIGPAWEKWLLDLVAIGTVADCQSLLGENRTLVKYGLKVLPKTRWLGLRQLMRNAGLEEQGEFDTYDIGFVLAPRINAAGRIQHADVAFKLLATEALDEAVMYAGQLESLNAHRQRLTEQIVAEARAQVLPRAEDKILFAVGDNWPKGVVGLVAGRLSEEFGRPAVVLERGGKLATGSARSVGDFNIVKAFASASVYLERFGGHSAAAGVTLKNEHLENFRAAVLDFAANHLAETDLEKTLEIDAVLDTGSIDDRLVEQLAEFEPFGPGNPSVNFLLPGLVVEQLKTVGATNKHLKVYTSSAGKILEFIGFNKAYRQASLRPGDKVQIVAEPSHNHWNGTRRIQLKIRDILKNEDLRA